MIALDRTDLISTVEKKGGANRVRQRPSAVVADSIRGLARIHKDQRDADLRGLEKIDGTRIDAD